MPGPTVNIAELRGRIDLVEIVSTRVALRRSGRRLVGLCPLHEETSPSFSVDEQKQLWHCFGCKQGGDVFDFVQKVESLAFMEAAQWLARRAGVALRSAKGQSQTEPLELVHEEAARFFQTRLLASEAAQARAYLEHRSISPKSIELFRLGWAPTDWEELSRHLRAKGFDEALQLKAGLVVKRQDSAGCYDRFRGRIIFPIMDTDGRPIGFGGRLLEDGQDGPKYLNSPETSLFQKSRVLYGLSQARRAIASAEQALIAEGYFDVISCHQAGIEISVAPLGTALTGQQVQILRRHAKRLYLCFDADSSGLAAAARSIPLFDRAALEVRVVAMPEGLDPDSLVRQRGGQELKGLMDSAKPLVEWQLDFIEKKYATSTSEGARLFRREALSVVAGLSEPIERIRFVKNLAERLAAADTSWLDRISLLERSLLRELEGTRETGGQARSPEPERQTGDRLEQMLLGTMLADASAAELIAREMREDDFGDPTRREIFAAAKELAADGKAQDLELLKEACSSAARAKLAELALTGLIRPLGNAALEEALERVRERRVRRMARDASMGRLPEADFVRFGEQKKEVSLRKADRIAVKKVKALSPLAWKEQVRKNVQERKGL
jgi:DNA primase